jgi:hypothetical protein
VNTSNFTMNRDDARLSVEVVSTIKTFLFKLPYIQEHLSFSSCDLSDLQQERGSGNGDSTKYDRFNNISKISVRPLLMRVLRSPLTPVGVTHLTTDESISEAHVIKLLCAQTLWLLVFNSKSLIKNNFEESNEHLTGLAEFQYYGRISKRKEHNAIISIRDVLKGFSLNLIAFLHFLISIIHLCT